MIRFTLFVDGSNLFGSLKEMGVQVEDYQTFYKFIFEQAMNTWKEVTVITPSPASQLKRVYWYEVGSMDEWDLADPKTQTHLRERFELDKELKRAYIALAGAKLPGEPQAKVATEAWAMCFKEFQDWYLKKQNTLEGMRRFHFAVRNSTDIIDIIECGHWKVDFLHRTLTEKGLDSSIAVDMIAFADNYDVAVLLSGDADSIPSINYLKTRNKHIGAIEFVCGYPPEKRGKSFSSRLKQAADFVTRIYEMELVSKGIARKGDPSVVSRA